MDWYREKATWPNSDHSKFVPAGDVRWHVQRMGKGTIKILLLHGSGATTHSFQGLVKELDGSCDLMLPDLPGHGFSSAIADKRASLDNVSKAVASLLEHEQFFPDCIIGHSAGAAIAANMASLELGLGNEMHREGERALRGIISINGAFYPFPGFSGHLFPAIAKMLFLNPFVPKFFAYSASDEARVSRLIESTGSNLSSDQIEYYRRALKSSHHVEGTLAMMANWDLEPMAQKLKNLPLPVLQIIGEKDGTIDPKASEKTQTLLQQGTRIVLESTGHLVHEEAPEKVASEILAFVRANCLAD